MVNPMDLEYRINERLGEVERIVHDDAMTRQLRSVGRAVDDHGSRSARRLRLGMLLIAVGTLLATGYSG